jgi:RNA recognition motif-containing protein
MKKLYVGNLPYSVTEDSLKAIFAQFGSIESVVVIKDRETGRAKGFGFVEFEAQADAEKALALNGRNMDGRTLKVNMAKPKESGGFGKRGRSSY